MIDDSVNSRRISDTSLSHSATVRQQRARMLAVITALLILYLFGEYSGILAGSAINWWSDLFWTFASLAAGWRSLLTAKTRTLAHERMAWNLFGLASLSWFVGMLIWDYYEIFGGDLIPFPSTGDWFFIGYAVFFSVGLLFYRAQAPNRLYNMIQVANLGIIVSTIIVLCFILLSPALMQSSNPMDYKLFALLHAIFTIVCFVFALYCYWFYVWQENLRSFRLMLAALLIFAITDTLYAFQLLGHTFEATSYLNVYWLIALALHYWAAFEQATVTRLPGFGTDSSGKPRAQKYEAIMPALCIFSVLAFSLYFRDELDENTYIVLASAAIAFTFFLTLREWYSNDLEISLTTEVQTSNARLANAQQIGHIGSWELDLANNELWCSEEVYRIFGVDPARLRPSYESLLSIVHPDDRERVDSAFAESIRNRTPFNSEHRLLLADGDIKHVMAYGETSYDHKGQPLRTTGTIQDISERAAMEEALRRSQKMEAVGQLAGGIAHDFNNQLGIIIGFLDILKRHTARDEQSRHWVENATTATQRCIDLTRQLLSFSRGQGQDASIVNLNDLIRELDAMITRSVTPEIEVQYFLASDLNLTRINPGEFHDAVLNMVINARDAMPGSGKLLIETSNKHLGVDYAARHPGIKAGDYVQLMLSDTGAGMDRKTLDHVFEPFFTTKPEGKGTGLGMAMVYGFATRYGGHVKIYSERDVGTTIRLYLPSSETAAAETRPVNIDEDELPTGDEAVLIVDDEPDLLQLLDRYLSELGYHTWLAENAAQALVVLAQEKQIDLLFSDVVMPGGMNGYELAKQATEQHPGLKVLLTSGFTSQTIANNGLARFSAHLLNKPYRKSDVAFRVREVLDETSDRKND